MEKQFKSYTAAPCSFKTIGTTEYLGVEIGDVIEVLAKTFCLD